MCFVGAGGFFLKNENLKKKKKASWIYFSLLLDIHVHVQSSYMYEF